jgi:hypothetical protein
MEKWGFREQCSLSAKYSSNHTLPVWTAVLNRLLYSTVFTDRDKLYWKIIHLNWFWVTTDLYWCHSFLLIYWEKIILKRNNSPLLQDLFRTIVLVSVFVFKLWTLIFLVNEHIMSSRSNFLTTLKLPYLTVQREGVSRIQKCTKQCKWNLNNFINKGYTT